MGTFPQLDSQVENNYNELKFSGSASEAKLHKTRQTQKKKQKKNEQRRENKEMINGRDRCHISTSHTLLINTVINRGVCSLQCSPVGGYAQLPPLPTFLSLLPSNFLISFSLVFFFFLSFSSICCRIPPDLVCLHVLLSSFLSSPFPSVHLPLHFCRRAIFHFCLCFLLHLSDFSPTTRRFSLSVSISVSLHFPLPDLHFFRLFPSLYFTCFNFASLWSFFYRVS